MHDPTGEQISLSEAGRTRGEKFERAVAIMARLRAPGGCPWDREQTFDSIKPFTLEETYEVLEAIDDRDWDGLSGELGDLLLQVLFYAEMAEEQGSFSIDEVLDKLSGKLIARHPHVFGDVTARTSGEVLRNWEALKRAEKDSGRVEGGAAEEKKGSGRASILDGISARVPALLEAAKISSRAATAGFDWPNIEGLFDKLTEETGELRRELAAFPEPGPQPRMSGVAGSGRPAIEEGLRARLEDEVGDLFFVLVNIARYLSLDAESALRKTNRKFTRRFRSMEAAFERRGQKLEAATLAEMEALWQTAKEEERASGAEPSR